MNAQIPGDADIRIGGRTYRLRLTLGALAYMEETIGGGDVRKLFERLKDPSPSDLFHLLHALMLGAGERMTVELLTSQKIDWADAARAIAKAFRQLVEDRPRPDEMSSLVSIATPPGKYPPRRRPSRRRRSPGPAGSATR